MSFRRHDKSRFVRATLNMDVRACLCMSASAGKRMIALLDDKRMHSTQILATGFASHAEGNSQAQEALVFRACSPMKEDWRCPLGRCCGDLVHSTGGA